MTEKESRQPRRSHLWDVLGPLAIVALLWRRRKAAQPPSEPPHQVPPDRDEPRPGAHLIAGQINLVVYHGAEPPAFDFDKLQRYAPALNVLTPYKPTTYLNQVVTFRLGERSFSVVPIGVPAIKSDSRLLRLTTQLNVALSQSSTNAPGTAQVSEPSTAARSLGAAAPPPADASAGAPRVSGAIPNWTAGAAIERNGSGSPGAKPTPLAQQPDPALELAAWQQGLLEMLARTSVEVRDRAEDLGAGVHIYILDTIPDQVDIERAPERWRSNTLLGALLDSERLKLHYAGGSHLMQQIDLYHDNANYVMSDHGLFVASIIHALAPKATLHLVEVLNPYGVGSLLSIANGFAIAAQALPQEPDGATSQRLIVNASLGFEIPAAVEKWLEHIHKKDPFWQPYSTSDIETFTDPLLEMCKLFADPQGSTKLRVVAAAGNDHGAGDPQRPPARYPAAFEAVLGVGALDHKQAFTDYTNQQDNPPGDGVVMFGGERVNNPASPQNGKTDPAFGMPGIYIGAFPDGEPNTAGWARWAGTSFATPLITGAIAVLMSQGRSFADAQAHLKQNRFWRV